MARNGSTKLADKFPAFGNVQQTIEHAFTKLRCSSKRREKSTEWSFKFWKTVFDPAGTLKVHFGVTET